MSNHLPSVACAVTALLLFIATPADSLRQEVQLERFEQTLGFELANTTGMRVRKFNRTTWILNGTAEVFQDFGNEYSFALEMAFSRLGNNQWNVYPLKVAQQGACDVLNGVYKDYQQHFVQYTSLPRIGDERFCPFPRGPIWVRHFAPGSDWVNPVVPAGYWRFTGDVIDPRGEPVIRLVGFFRIVREFV